MLLYFIRHGESAHNAEGRIQGHSDVPLSELGRRQSAAVAAALADMPIDALYASPLRRALETAQPIADRIGLPIVTDPRLKEINAGVFQNRRRSELPELHPEEYQCWLSGDPDFTIPQGESRRALMARGNDALHAIRDAGPAHAVVVSHGGLISAVLKVLLDIPAHRHPFRLENGSISRIDWTDGRVKLLSLNETHHLLEVGLAGCGDL
ncbi:MAG: histidine phosphatase family protein [Patescibacteria group bacterium]|nr:histidine phosphatase family protein [Patescibacteria group bacterium]